ncbi:MAG: prolyl oligopeptidase family serine peptidase [Candidatus Eisenbacteria bacterium]
MKRILAATVAVSVVTVAFGLWGDAAALAWDYPQALRQPATDVYHGITVTEDYRWLEDLNDPAVKQWLREENALSRGYLDEIRSRGPILNRLKELYTRGPRYFWVTARPGVLFAMKDQPPKNHPMLVAMRSADDPGSERVLVDTDLLSPQVPTAIDWYVPSLDGRLVAVSLSERGSEDGSVHVFDVATGSQLKDVVPRAQYATAGGDVAWKRDATGFYYTRYPQGNERPEEDMSFYQQVYFHRLGTPPVQDTYVIGKEFPKIAEIELETTDDGAYLLASVANGDGGEFAYYLMNPEGNWSQVAEFQDKVVSAVLGKDGKLYMLSRKGMPRGAILFVPLAGPALAAARTLIPQGSAVIDYFEVTPSRLYSVDVEGGPHRMRVFDLAGKSLGQIPIKPVSAVWQIEPLDGDAILYSNETYLEPMAYYAYDPAKGTSRKTALAVTTPADFSDTEIIRDAAISKDGTSIPMSILRRKGLILDGRNPVLLTGYGGYGVNQAPGFQDWLRLWIEQGGVYVDTNLRGGGEFGEDWHQAGNLTHKQNVFDDFIACVEHLVDQGYTDPAKLAIEGGSNGGLLMGAVLTQRPALFRAVVSHVGIYDALRTELFDNGVFNVTEFGTVTDREQFGALYAYSPYHHVKDGTAYPAVLMMTGDNDIRVEPMQSRKMTARLQAATSSGLPVLLRTNPNAGHGIGTALDDQIEEEADVLGFIFDQLGMRYQSVGR